MSAFVICRTCHQRCEDPEGECPHCGAIPTAVPIRLVDDTHEVEQVVIEAEEVGEHRFSADPRELPLCLDCGTPLADASARRCGPS